MAKPDGQRLLLERLNNLSFSGLNQEGQLIALRTYEIICSRLGKPSPDLLDAMRARLEPLYPARDWHLNHRLCTLLVYLESTSVISKTLDLLARAERPEDFMQYLFYLRYVRSEWTTPQREAWFRALAYAEQKQGARDYYSVLKRIRDDFLAAVPSDLAQHLANIETTALRQNAPEEASLSSGERAGLTGNSATSLRGGEGPLSLGERAGVRGNGASGLQPASALHFVKDWQLSDFNLAQPLRNRSLENGRAAFHTTQCALCHRFGNEGGLVGPDLTSVASRYDRRTVLESILDPSKVIDDKFRNTSFTLKDGTKMVGTIDREDEQQLLIRESPFVETATPIRKETILRRELSPVSPMPTGLVDVLDRDAILDLLAYLASSPQTNSATPKP